MAATGTRSIATLSMTGTPSCAGTTVATGDLLVETVVFADMAAADLEAIEEDLLLVALVETARGGLAALAPAVLAVIVKVGVALHVPEASAVETMCVASRGPARAHSAGEGSAAKRMRSPQGACRACTAAVSAAACAGAAVECMAAARIGKHESGKRQKVWRGFDESAVQKESC